MRLKNPPPELGICPLFADLSREEQADVERLATRQDFAPGDVLLSQGAPAQHLFVLLAGAVRVFLLGGDGQEVTVKLFVAPAVFGEMELLTRTVHIENVQAMRGGHLAKFDVAATDRLLDRYPTVCKRLLVDTCARFRTTAKNQGFVAFETVEQRLAALLLSYVRVCGAPVAGGVQIVWDGLTQDLLARGVAATRKSAQRAFKRWGQMGILSRRGRYYVVSDVARFAEIAGEDPPHFDHQIDPA
ncbi:MAG: Crp/Fnr family transcriptional regulator [Deltaproteobacteria bacterium]|nr:Crp/Fnr family transcriptional regulator [Deltaproteobacteria bacterium]